MTEFKNNPFYNKSENVVNVVNNILKKNNGNTLISVLAAIVLVSLLFTFVAKYFLTSYEQSNYLNREYNCTQICEALLKVYRSKPYTTLVHDVGKTIAINDIKETLQLDPSCDVSGYSANVTIRKHPDEKLADRALLIEVSVSQTGKPPVIMEGIVRK